jgi:hypothetical protein
MNAPARWILALLLATALAAAEGEAPTLETDAPAPAFGELAEDDPPEQQPRVARTRVELYRAVETCLHWGGEEPYDDVRARQIAEGWARDCAEAVRLAENALARYPDDGYVAACAVVLVGYHVGPSAIADALMGDDATWRRRCESARLAMDELRGVAPDLHSDLEVYADDACPTGARPGGR